MKNHRKFKCVARVLLNAWLLFPAMLTAAQLPNRTAAAVYGQGGDFTSHEENYGGLGINAANLKGADGVAVDSGGNMYVADTMNNRVLYYPKGSTTATRVYGQYDDYTTGEPNKYDISANSLNGPTAVVVDSSGNLYVADSGNNRVLFYNPPPEFVSIDDPFYWTAQRVYGQDNFTSGAANKGGSISTTSLNNPMGLALDGSGNLYIADAYNHRVLSYASGSIIATRVYGQAGSFSTNTANYGGASANSLNMPAGVAVDGIGNVIVADLLNHRVLTYAGTSTTATRVYGQGGSFTSKDANKDGISGNSLNMPIAVLADGSGNLFVTDLSNHRVLCFPSASTTATRVYGQDAFNVGSANKGSSTSASSLSNPFGLAMDSSGSLYVADESNNRVLRYANPLSADDVYGQGGVFTTNTENKDGRSANSLNWPSATAVDSSGDLYVADTNNHRVLYYPAGSSTATRVYGQLGSFSSNTPNKDGVSANSLDTPGGIALDSHDNLYVADTYNCRVLFYLNGSNVATRVYGQGGNYNTRYNTICDTGLFGPGGVAVDSNDNLYVADSMNNRVLYYASGSITATRVYGQGGSFITNHYANVNADSLWNPNAMALDSSGNLYVADTYNHRVLYYEGTSITATRVYGQLDDFNTHVDNKGDISADSFYGPYGVALDSGNNLYVADLGNHRVLYFAAGDSSPSTADLVYGQGESFSTNDINKGGLGAKSLNNPCGVTVARGSLYVADQANHRVLKYVLPEAALADAAVPTVVAFSATTPSSSIHIPISAFSATDDIGVTGYLITTSSSQPSAGAGDWSTYAPATYTVTDNGDFTLYPWVKDAVGKVSSVYSPPVAVTVNAPTYMITYVGNGSDGGSPPSDARAYPSGVTATVLGNSGTLVKTNLFFDGWNTTAEGNGTAYHAGDHFTISADTTLYAQWVPPRNSLSFDGYDDYVSIADANDLDMTRNYTLELWFRADGFGEDGALRGLISKYQHGGADGYFLRLTGNELDFDGQFTTGLNLQTGVWYHVAAVNDDGTRRLYVNGVDKTSLLQGDPLAVLVNDNELTLGTEFLDDNSRFFDGTMDEVRIWNVARSQADIQANRNHELSGTQSGLVAYYNFNGLIETSLTDVTPNGHTGTLTNGPEWVLTEGAMDWILTATADAHGTISPAGNVTVPPGGNKNFTITPATYYHIADVTKNGVTSLGAVSNYSWTNVTADGAIHATFTPDLAAGGTPHWWLAEHGWTTNFDAAEAADSDGDGQSAAQEYLADTDPTVSSSALRVTEIVNGATVTVIFATSANRLYTLYRNANLAAGGWIPVTGQIDVSGTGSPLTLTDSSPQPLHGFYRVGARVP
jgi:hypothetical protein